jgi:hypothetical protein
MKFKIYSLLVQVEVALLTVHHQYMLSVQILRNLLLNRYFGMSIIIRRNKS